MPRGASGERKADAPSGCECHPGAGTLLQFAAAHDRGLPLVAQGQGRRLGSVGHPWPRLNGTLWRVAVGGTLWAVFQVDRAHRDDLEEILEIADARRQQYVEYQPRFWRPAQGAVDRQGAFFASLLASDDAFLGVARQGGRVDGLAARPNG